MELFFMVASLMMTSAEFLKRFGKKRIPRAGRSLRHQEDDLAMQCFAEHQKLYPGRLIYHVPNGGKRNAFEGARMKKMGVRKGMLDYHIPEARGRFIGLWIELKVDYFDPETGKLVAKNRMSKEQKEVKAALEKLGHKVAECRSVGDFLKEVTYYYSLPDIQHVRPL